MLIKFNKKLFFYRFTCLHDHCIDNVPKRECPRSHIGSLQPASSSEFSAHYYQLAKSTVSKVQLLSLAQSSSSFEMVNYCCRNTVLPVQQEKRSCRPCCWLYWSWHACLPCFSSSARSKAPFPDWVAWFPRLARFRMFQDSCRRSTGTAATRHCCQSKNKVRLNSDWRLIYLQIYK